jgi:hypothetical protein
MHDNVLRLHIHRRPFDEYLYRAFSILPLLLLRLIIPLFPLWTLPRTIILKEQKPDWDEEFENEKTIYARLSALQGLTIPVYFGEASVEGRRALILSDVGRVSLCGKPSLERDREDIARMIDEPLRAITKFGVEYNDVKLDNFHIVSANGGDRIMIVDLESVAELDPARAPERAMVYTADRLFMYWRQAEECHRRDKEQAAGMRCMAPPRRLPVPNVALGRPPGLGSPPRRSFLNSAQRSTIA